VRERVAETAYSVSSWVRADTRGSRIAVLGSKTAIPRMLCILVATLGAFGEQVVNFIAAYR
jgi:hypothetical protein